MISRLNMSSSSRFSSVLMSSPAASNNLFTFSNELSRKTLRERSGRTLHKDLKKQFQFNSVLAMANRSKNRGYHAVY